MTNVTTRRVQTKDFKNIERQFARLMRGSTDQHLLVCFNSLCSESERIMLVKRFGAIFLFTKGYSKYRAARVMGISQSTAQRLYGLYRSGSYDDLFNVIPKKQQNAFIRFLTTLTAAQVDTKARAKLVRGTW